MRVHGEVLLILIINVSFGVIHGYLPAPSDDPCRPAAYMEFRSGARGALALHIVQVVHSNADVKV